MVVTVLAWILITLVCWAWGMLWLQVMRIFLKDRFFIMPHFGIVCLCGMVMITIFAGILSLFFGLGNWMTHLLILGPSILVFLVNRKQNFLQEIKNEFTGFHPATLFLLVASLAVVLIMCSWKINHPDTLGYHAQTVLWIEKFKAVPGLAHLHARYGYQGLWFVTCAFFDSRFAGIDTITIANSTIIVWFLFFVVHKINEGLYLPTKRISSLVWILLLIGCCISYTQIRLTITSASPDFVSALYIWVVFYLFLSKANIQSSVYWITIITLAVFSISIKLSGIPVSVIAIASFVRLVSAKKTKAAVVSALLTFLVCVPLFARNIIASGYPFFPSHFPDVANVDWKLEKKDVQFEKDYITAFARYPVSYDQKEVESVLKMPAGEWLPRWWQHVSAADRCILFLCVVSLLMCIIQLKKILRSDWQTKVSLLTAFGGIVFWFIQAPHPRFGFGFIIPLISFLFIVALNSFIWRVRMAKGVISMVTLSLGLGVAAYGTYRAVRFSSVEQLIKPIGLEKVQGKTIHCENILLHKPADNSFCSDLSLPCFYSDTCTFELRGKSITDGFRARTSDKK